MDIERLKKATERQPLKPDFTLLGFDVFVNPKMPSGTFAFVTKDQFNAALFTALQGNEKP